MSEDKTSATYIISDTHWNHEELFEAFKRPADVNILMIRRWKATVTENDLVLHLGDVIWDKQLELKGILNSLPGKKILVKGNHDKRTDNWYMNNGFSFSCDSLVYRNILFSHVPMKIPDGVDWNIFGHFHTIPREKWGTDEYPIITSKHLLFALEEMNYMPVKLERFLKMKNNIKNIKENSKIKKTEQTRDF